MKVFVIINLLMGVIFGCQTKTPNNDTLTDSIEIDSVRNSDFSTNCIRMDSIPKQARREFKQIKIRYFDSFEGINRKGKYVAGKHFDITIWNDSIFLSRHEWVPMSDRKLEEVEKEEILKDSDLINSLSNYIFFFFVEKNNYIILNPREQGEVFCGNQTMFDIIVYRGTGNPIKKSVTVESDFIYSDEFMNFLHLLDSI